MKIYALMIWSDHEGLYNDHEPEHYFTTEEEAQKALDETLAKWIVEGIIESNDLWYDQSDPETDEPDDVWMWIDEITVHDSWEQLKASES